MLIVIVLPFITVREPDVLVEPARKSIVPAAAVSSSIFLFCVNPVTLIPPVFALEPICKVPAVIPSSNPSERVSTPPAPVPTPIVEALLYVSRVTVPTPALIEPGAAGQVIVSAVREIGLPPLVNEVEIVIVGTVKSIPAAPVVVTAPVKVVIPCPSVCVIVAASTVDEKVALFALVMVRSSIARIFPTAPVRAISPPVPALRVKSLAAPLLSVTPVILILFPATTPPPFVVSRVTVAAPIRTLSLIVIAFPAVTILAFRVVVAPGPSRVIDASPEPVIRPLTAIVPPPAGA